MNPTVLRTDVATILTKWESGTLNNEQVHLWASERYAVDAWDTEDDAVNEVLAQLDMMDMNLVIAEDVPALLAALEETSAQKVEQIFKSHQNTINFESRTHRRKNEPLYSPFCGEAVHPGVQADRP